MARLDLRLDLAMPNHIKVLRLEATLGDAGFAALVRLWCYVGSHHRSTGRLDGFTPAEVEAVARWKGEPGAFHARLVCVGLLDEDGVTVHDWVAEQPHLAQYDAWVGAARESGRAGGLASGQARKPKRRPPLNGGVREGPTIGTRIGATNGGVEPPTLTLTRPDTSGGDSDRPSPRASVGPDTTTPSLRLAEPEGSEEGAEAEPDRSDPQSAMAAAIHVRIGGRYESCYDAVREAIADGLTVEELAEHLSESPPAKGSSVFAWKRAAVASFRKAPAADEPGGDRILALENDPGWYPDHWPFHGEAVEEYRKRTGSDLRTARAAFAKARRLDSWDHRRAAHA